MIRLETFIREAFIRKQHLTAVFFDLEKAYDTTWKYGIMRDLHDLGLRGRKHYFHANTMKDLFENVHMDNVLSFLKETGLYQKI